MIKVTSDIKVTPIKEISKRFGKCCHKLMIGVDKYDFPDKQYIEILSRGALTLVDGIIYQSG